MRSTPAAGRPTAFRSSPFRRGRLTSVLVVALFGAALAPPARAQVADPDFWRVNGEVDGLAISGNTLYVGGPFDCVGPRTGSAVPVSTTTGVPVAGFPRVHGFLAAIVPDGSGGWFLGGGFDRVGDVERSNLAHVLPDLSVSSWAPSVDQAVNTLALSGGVLYAGGSFTHVGNQGRGRLAAFDAATGALRSWNPNADRPVYALAVDDTTVYAGGEFTLVGGQARVLVAAISSVTGQVTAFDAQNTSSGSVQALAVSGGRVYVGGAFSNLGGQTRSNLAALSPATGLAFSWAPDPDGPVSSLAASGSVVYVGGAFANIGGQERFSLAAVQVSNAHATGWHPDPTMFSNGIPVSAQIYALAVSGTTVYVGGYYLEVGGLERSRVAALSASSGTPTSWNPVCDDVVTTIAVAGSVVYLGGGFESVGGVVRRGLAAFDVTSGHATGFRADVDDARHGAGRDPDAALRGRPVPPDRRRESRDARGTRSRDRSGASLESKHERTRRVRTRSRAEIALRGRWLRCDRWTTPLRGRRARHRDRSAHGLGSSVLGRRAFAGSAEWCRLRGG